MEFDFKTNKSEDMVLIDMNSWVENSSNLVQSYKMSGRQIPTYITKIVDTNIVSDKYKEDKGTLKIGTYILLTRAVSELANFRSYTIMRKKYYNVPIPHIVGYFKDNKITVDSLELTTKKVLIEEIEKKQEGVLISSDNKATIGKVLKIGRETTSVSAGDIVLLKDNVATVLMIEGKKYYSVEEQDIVGIFNNDKYTLEDITLINESVIMVVGYEKEESDSILLKPNMDYEELDYSDIYNRDLFLIVKVDPKLTKLSAGDIIILNRDATCYIYLDDKKYFIVNGMTNIEGKIQ